jgi:hypothetical protein
MASIVDVFEIIVNATYVLVLHRCWITSSQSLCLQFNFFTILQPHSIRSFNLRMFRTLYQTASRINYSEDHYNISTITVVVLARSYSTVQAQNCCFLKSFGSELGWVSVSY